MDYKLTIGIPTLNRPEFLETLFRSLVAQTMSAHIVVGDQGEKLETQLVVEKFDGLLDIEYRRTKATCLWDNWVKTARECKTHYFSWVQDDDWISPGYVARIVNGFDYHELCTVWLSILKMSYNTEGFSCWWEGNGPPIPLDFVNYGVSEVLGDMIPAVSPFISPALSPAIAFRVNSGFDDMLESIPVDCDLFHERMHITEWAIGKRVLCDPWISGSWRMHEGNISKVLNQDVNLKKRQLKTFLDWLEPFLERFDWEDVLVSWSRLVSPNTLTTIIGTLKDYRSHRLARRTKEILLKHRPDLIPLIKRQKPLSPVMA